MLARVGGQPSGQHVLGGRLPIRVLVRPADAVEGHELIKAAVRAAHPEVETRPGLAGESHPDGAILRGRGGDLEDMAAPAPPPCGGALLGQRFRRGLVLGVLVLVQLVQDQGADGFVAQTRHRARPAQIDGHVRQIDAQAGGIVPVAGHVLAQARRGLDHGDDTVLGILAGRDLVGEHIHHRPGAAVDAPAHQIVAGFRAARLRALADDDRLHTRRPGGVHDAHKVGGEDVLPLAGDAGHLHHAMALRPLADRDGTATAQDLLFALGKTDADPTAMLPQIVGGSTGHGGRKPVRQGRRQTYPPHRIRLWQRHQLKLAFHHTPVTGPER